MAAGITRDRAGRAMGGAAAALFLAAVSSACGSSEPAQPFPQPGDPAPGFSLPSAEGNVVSLSDFEGRKVLLYFSMGPG